MLHLDKLEITGKRGTSVIEFAQNLTVIMGKSETGKTTIYKCIDYLFGAKSNDAHRPFLTSTGYDTIIGYFTTELGTIKISRKVDAKKLTIETDIKDIDATKEYSIDSKKPEWIGNIYNQLIGVPKGLKIPWSRDGKMKLFSWRTAKKAFMIHEKLADTGESVILPEVTTEKTAFLSNLLYLLYKIDFTEYDAEEGTRIKKIRKAAIQRYIKSKKELITQKMVELQGQLEGISLDDSNIATITTEIKENLNNINKSIQQAVSQEQVISKQIIELQEHINEARISIDRFEILESQYASDIKRLGFIVDCERITSSIPKETKCPICNGQIEIQNQKSYIEAARAELSKTMDNANELNDAKKDLLLELQEQECKLSSLNQQKATIQKTLNDELVPVQNNLEAQLYAFSQIIEYNKALSLYAEMDSLYDKDYVEYDKIEAEIDYKPKALFEPDFAEKIASYYTGLLETTNFSPIQKVVFDMDLFDMVINDNPKPNRSKGYSSYFNSLLVLSLRCYFNEHAEINPHFYLLDSPLHGLMTETSDENNEDDLRKGFFNYLFNNYGNDQIIVIENTEKKELPKIDFDSRFVKVYTFTKDANNGRYGFLDGVFQN